LADLNYRYNSKDADLLPRADRSTRDSEVRNRSNLLLHIRTH
jgi:hypothetical protein